MGQQGPCRTNLQGAAPSRGSSVALFPNSGGKGTAALGVVKGGGGPGIQRKAPRFLGGLGAGTAPSTCWPGHQGSRMCSTRLQFRGSTFLYIYNSSFHTHAHTSLHFFRIIKVKHLKRGQMSSVIEKCKLKSYTPPRMLTGGTLSIGEPVKQLHSHRTHQGINPVAGGNYAALTCGRRARAALGSAVPPLLYSQHSNGRSDPLPPPRWMKRGSGGLQPPRWALHPRRGRSPQVQWHRGCGWPPPPALSPSPFEAAVLHQGRFGPQGVWRHFRLAALGRTCLWHLVGGGQEWCPDIFQRTGRPSPSEAHLAKMPIA